MPVILRATVSVPRVGVETKHFYMEVELLQPLLNLESATGTVHYHSKKHNYFLLLVLTDEKAIVLLMNVCFPELQNVLPKICVLLVVY